MEKRQLGRSDLMITPLGVGAWAMGGNNWAFGWGPQDDADSVAAIHAALDAGWNWIDTAAVYGLGHSEEVVARALAGMAARPYVFTKCALVWDADGKVSGRLKRESVLKECEDSLRRLKVEAIDLYQIHWPDPEEDLDEAWEAIEALKAKGSIRWAGVCQLWGDPAGWPPRDRSPRCSRPIPSSRPKRRPNFCPPAGRRGWG